MPTIEHNRKYSANNYLLRWVMEYEDKSYNCGMWSRPGLDFNDKASMQKREGLVKVSIQCKHRISCEIKNMVVRDGKLFREIKMISAMGVPGSSTMKKFGAVRLAPNIHGMILLTHNEKIACFIDGRVLATANTDKLIIGAS